MSSSKRLQGLAHDESGIAMMLALTVMLILSMVVVALAGLAVSEYSTAATLDRSTQALLAAQAGQELAISRLRGDADWSDNAAATWQAIDGNQPEAFPVAAPVGTFNVQVRQPSGLNATGNIEVRSIGQVRGATRTIQFTLHRVSGADFVTYSITTVNTTAISGGGSQQWHGSAYFEDDLTMKGGSQSGFYNDRKVFSSDPGFFNHLYVCGWTGTACADGDLTLTTGNPTIGNPYHWVHVTDQVTGSSTNYNPSNFDRLSPEPFYPDVLQGVKDALAAPANALNLAGPATMVVCARVAGIWVTIPSADLTLAGGNPFYLPKAGTGCPAASDPRTIANIRADPSLYALVWEASATPANLTFSTTSSGLPIYVPGKVIVGADVRFEKKGSLVVANDPTATIPAALQARNGCALDFNGTGLCTGLPSSGHWIKASVSPCQGSPGTDNPSTTYPQTDLLGFIVNGSAYSNLNGSSCSQEMNLVAVVGDRNAPATPGLACTNPASRAHIDTQKKLQWYGVLMTREMCLAQVPDFWQVPDLAAALPPPLVKVIVSSGGSIQVMDWQELF
jgi:Tfp pilus assembly protein PilV